MKTPVLLQRSVLYASLLLLGPSLPPFLIHAEEGQVTGAMILTPTDRLSDVSPGAVEHTQKACIARNPNMASVGQRMLAERTCQSEEVARKTHQGPPQF
jgi:hypothetical protein